MPPRKRPRLYLSGPITKGCRSFNQYQSNVAHERLMRDGFAVMNPMPTGVLPFAWTGSLSHADWLESDFEFVAVCEAVYRLPGESVGADMETAFAEQLGIPVFTDYDSLLNWQAEWQKAHVPAIERAA